MYRDLMCGKISSTNEGKKVKLAGWVSRRREIMANLYLLI